MEEEESRVTACDAIMATLKAHAAQTLARDDPGGASSSAGAIGRASHGQPPQWGGAEHWAADQWKAAFEEVVSLHDVATTVASAIPSPVRANKSVHRGEEGGISDAVRTTSRSSTRVGGRTNASEGASRTTWSSTW